MFEHGLALSRVMRPDDRSIALSESDINDIVALKCKRVRIEVSLSSARDVNNNVIGAREFTPDLLSLYRTVVDAFKKRGLKVHLILPNQILAVASPETWHIPPTPEAWTEYAQGYAETFGLIAQELSDADLVEAINEQNNIGNNSYIPPAQYAELYHLARESARKYTRAPICFGGLFAHDMQRYKGVTWQNSGAEYLKEALTALSKFTKDPPDAVGLHPYLNGGGVLDTKALQTYLNYWRIETTAEINITEAGWQAPQVFDPETGKVLDGVSLEEQASNIVSLVKTLRDEEQVASCMIFTSQDAADGSVRWGLRDIKGNKKLSYKAVQDLV